MKKHLLLLIPFCLLLILLTTGCATLMAGEEALLAVDSMPQKAKVIVKAVDMDETIKKVTPCTINLNKSSDYIVRIEYMGYRTQEIIIRRSYNTGIYGDIVGGVLISPAIAVVGLGLDFYFGNIYTHNLYKINAEMEKAQDLGKLPDEITIEVPFTLIHSDGKKVVQYIPVTFYKI